MREVIEYLLLQCTMYLLDIQCRRFSIPEDMFVYTLLFLLDVPSVPNICNVATPALLSGISSSRLFFSNRFSLWYSFQYLCRQWLRRYRRHCRPRR